MEQFYRVQIGEERKEYLRGTTFADIAKEYQKDYKEQIVLAVRNGKIRELLSDLTKIARWNFLRCRTTPDIKHTIAPLR